MNYNDDLLRYAVAHSNRIEREPTEGLSFDNHMRAVLLARTASEAGQLLHPRVLHQIIYEGLEVSGSTHPNHGPHVPGQYRAINVMVNTRDGPHVFPSAGDVPMLMREWWVALFQSWAQGSPNLNTEDVRWQFHAWFEAIHPFVDGNGRAGRASWWNTAMTTRSGLTVIAFEERYDYYDRLDAWRAQHERNGLPVNPFR